MAIYGHYYADAITFLGRFSIVPILGCRRLANQFHYRVFFPEYSVNFAKNSHNENFTTAHQFRCTGENQVCVYQTAIQCRADSGSLRSGGLGHTMKRLVLTDIFENVTIKDLAPDTQPNQGVGP